MPNLRDWPLRSNGVRWHPLNRSHYLGAKYDRVMLRPRQRGSCPKASDFTLGICVVSIVCVFCIGLRVSDYLASGCMMKSYLLRRFTPASSSIGFDGMYRNRRYLAIVMR